MRPSSDKETEQASLLSQAAAGDLVSLGRLLETNRGRLKKMVAARMDPRLLGRVDASDVVQEALAEAAQRFSEYAAQEHMPFFVWLRLVTYQRMNANSRFHLGAQRRSASREVSLFHRPLHNATSADLAARLLGALTQPSEAAIRAEARCRLQQAIEQLPELDREVLVMRHFEQLTYAETAHELGLSEEAIKKRHIRALQKLRRLLDHE